MYLEWLQLGQVRNLQQMRLDPGPGLNVFTGPNASGKTAILESLYLLGRARSFRTPKIKEVIHQGEISLHVAAGLIYSGSGLHVTTGIEKGRGQVAIRYNGSPVRTVSEQARQFPLVLLTPESHDLISGTPKQRRHWLDWAMFHVERSYLQVWRDYFRALRHRNSLLRLSVSDPGAYQAWEAMMGKTASHLSRLREEFVNQLVTALEQPPASVLEGPEVTIQHFPGWTAASEDFAEYLADVRDMDRAAGFTRYGPHRADLVFLSDGVPVSGRFSRGQVKLFVCRLIMAEALVLERLGGEPPLYLQDDYTAELDNEACDRLLFALSKTGWQCYLNTTEREKRGFLSDDVEWFHVEHGQVAKVVE